MRTFSEGDRPRRDLTLLEVELDDDELAAIEGWRQANLFGSRADALRALVRLGLMSEIGRTYRSLMLENDGEEPAAAKSGTAQGQRDGRGNGHANGQG